MKVKIDWQHVTLVVIALVTSLGPVLFANMSQGKLSQALAALGPAVAILNTVLAILKASIVAPGALPLPAPPAPPAPEAK